jgi:hypothetical protein
MHADETLGQREADAQAAMRARLPPVELPEHLEDLHQLPWRNSHAVVAHGHDDVVFLRAHRQIDRRAFGRIAGRVVEQVSEHLRETRRVGM